MFHRLNRSSFQMYPHLVPPVEYPEVQHGEKFRNFLRKSPASFSWDWGPAFIPSGIWKSVTLVYNQALYVEEMGVRARVLDDKEGKLWGVEAEVRIIPLIKLRKYPEVMFEIRNLQDGSHLSNSTNSSTYSTDSEGVMTLKLSVNVTGVDLWFPAKFGKQSLYELSLHLRTARQNISSTKQFGFRTVILDRNSFNRYDQYNVRFDFIINDRWIYIKGANLVPLSVFESSSYNLTAFFNLVEYAGMASHWRRSVHYLFICSMFNS